MSRSTLKDQRLAHTLTTLPMNMDVYKHMGQGKTHLLHTTLIAIDLRRLSRSTKAESSDSLFRKLMDAVRSVLPGHRG